MEQQTKKRARKAKKSGRMRRIAVDRHGNEYRVTGADGKYLYCEGGIKFLHASGCIVAVKLEDGQDGAEVKGNGD